LWYTSSITMPELKLSSPERLAPALPERKPETLERTEAQKPQPTPETVARPELPNSLAVPAAPVPASARVLTPLQQEVENVLAEGLEDLYRSLEPRAQAQFRAQGEATAIKLSTLISQVKFKLSEILRLIREWLQSIPGVNRYFVEQTAKIKADKILKLH